jgi:two-component system, NtrC family, response regulator AlgB
MDLLIIDDEASLRRTLRTALESMGHHVAEAPTAALARSLVEQQHFDLAFLDLRLGREAGLDLLPELCAPGREPGIAVVVVTAYAAIETAVEAMRRGAFDFLPKPFTPDQIRITLDRFQLVQGLRHRVASLEEQVRSVAPEVDLETQDSVMRAALEVAWRVASSEATILLRGDSGTGKGVLAQAIHERSPRAGRPFVTVHCPSLSAELLESDLFGHVRGAFTGAVRDTEGKVAAGEGGTLFLDEIGDLPLGLQPKLLRFLQERTYERVGDNRMRRGDVRLLAATNHDLEAAVRTGRFREDLLYRLNVIEITLPPLRQRPSDIPALAQHLLQFFARESNKVVTGFTPEALEALRRHDWPGNLRELRNAIERGVILARDHEVGLADLPSQLGQPMQRKIEVGSQVSLEDLEAEHIRRVLAISPSLDDAARTLGIDPSTLYRKRKRHGL